MTSGLESINTAVRKQSKDIFSKKLKSDCKRKFYSAYLLQEYGTLYILIPSQPIINVMVPNNLYLVFIFRVHKAHELSSPMFVIKHGVRSLKHL